MTLEQTSSQLTAETRARKVGLSIPEYRNNKKIDM